MNKDFYYNIAKEYIDYLDVDEIYSSDRYYFSDYFSTKFTVESGASKIVLIPNDINKKYVVKIPIKGSSYSSYYYYDESEDIVEEESDICYNDFYNAYEALINPTDEEYERLSDWNYCEVEVCMYERALNNKVENFFLKTEYLNSYRGIPIYLQEKATKIGKGDTSVSDKSLGFCDSHTCEINGDRYCNAILIDYYGEEKYLALLNFWETVDVNDLHSHNFGYLDSRPVFFDYCGFND